MIKLSSSTVLIKSRDGTSRAFEPEELQARLVDSCIASGVSEFWLAEDLVNAVETALLAQSDDGVSFFDEAEVSGIVARALDEAGYPEVAEKFRSGGGQNASTENVTGDSLRELFGRRLAVSGAELDELVVAVMDSCERIGVTDPDHTLLLELGRALKRSKNAPQPAKLSLGIVKNGRDNASSSPWIAVQADIESNVSPKTRLLLGAGALGMDGVSRLFPSIKINLRLAAFTEFLGLDAPVTELALFPRLSSVSKAIDELAAAAERLVHSSKEHAEQDLPVYLRFADTPLFVKKFLATDPSNGMLFCSEIAECLSSQIRTPITIRGMRGQ